MHHSNASGWQPDITKAKELLGWSPTVKRAEGLRKTMDYFRKKLGIEEKTKNNTR